MKIEDGRKVYVSNESVEDALEQKKERVILTSNEENCICVDIRFEKEFLEGKDFHTIPWNFFIEIPKMRHMIRDEMLGKIANELYKGYVVRYKGGGWRPSSYHTYSTTLSLSRYEYATISPTGEIGEPQKFEVPIEETPPSGN